MPRYVVGCSVLEVISGFSVHIDQEYWGFGIFGAVWQGIIVVARDRKNTIRAITKE